MSSYNIIVNDVQRTKDKVLCLARIDNYKNMLKHVSIGEYISMDPIQLNFHDSIGKSNWVIMFFPKGQYVSSQDPTALEVSRASLYLKMVYCDNQENSLAATIKFFIKSPFYEMKDNFSSTKSATFLYRNPIKRWVGPFHLVSTDELFSNRCEHFFYNDSLTIGCEMNVTMSRPSVPFLRSMKKSKENLNATGEYDNHIATDAFDVRMRQNMLRKQNSSVSQNDFTIQSGKKYFHENSNKKRSRGTQTWHEKLLQSCNEKIENNLKSEELPAKNDLKSPTTTDTRCVRFKIFNYKLDLM